MRFYSLILSDVATGLVWQPTATGNGFIKAAGGVTFSSFVNGKNIPGALNIEIDLPVVPQHTPQGQGYIKIWGVGLGMINQASNLNGANLSLTAGMRPGLPLATAQAPQAGLLVKGTVYQAFGNWEGVNQTLDLVFTPPALASTLPGATTNISFNWVKGTSLASALAVTFAQSFPQLKAVINIGSALVLSSTEPGIYDNLPQFASYVNGISLKVGTPTYGPNYPGVMIAADATTITASDGTATAAKGPTQLAFQDLIGQPTWLGPSTIGFKTVLRSDLQIFDKVMFPQGIQSPYSLTSSSAAYPNTPASSKTAFQGAFSINEVHHFANFRQPDGDSWNTSFKAVPVSL